MPVQPASVAASRRLRLLAVLGLAAGALLLLRPPAQAIINPNFTPADLVRQAATVLHVQLGPVARDGACAVKAVKALKGQAPEKLVLCANVKDEAVQKAAGEALGAAAATPALLFTGDFSTAALNADSERPQGQQVGALLAGTNWFGLFQQADGTLRIDKDPLELRAVWAGGVETLARAVEYALGDPRADFPVNAGATWAGEALVAKLDGRVHGCSSVELRAGEKPCLFVACEKGDRLFQHAPDGTGFRDLTPGLGLTSRSRAFAWGDFNGDGLLDLASCEGRTVRLWRQTQKGPTPFAAANKETVLPFEASCIMALDSGGKDGADLLACSPAGLALLHPTGGGAFEVRPLPSPTPELAAKLGAAGPAVLADFDGDGRPDIAQPWTKGVLLYRGKGPGEFEPPRLAGQLDCEGVPTGAFAADFDADGLPDLLVTCEGKCRLLLNTGERFENRSLESGELCYISQPGAFAGAACDINRDGREDVLLLYPKMGPQLFFNRGFRCFGHAIPLDLSNSQLKAAKALAEGQQAGTVADLNGDGAPDLAAVSPSGESWVLFRNPPKAPVLSVTVSLPPGATGPVTVSAADGVRSFGARTVAAGAPAIFAKAEKGPLTVKWRWPGAVEQSRQVVVLKQERLELPRSDK